MPVTLADKERHVRISLRRGEHFFGNGARGICERFERRDDRLYEFAEILDWIIALDAQLIPAAITTRFVQSARHGGFGWRRYGPRRGHTVADLIDLNRYSSVAPGQYPLRPSTFMVGEIPLHMRAPKSVWVSWLREQALPVPRELATGLTISVAAEPALLSAPASASDAAEPLWTEPAAKPPKARAGPYNSKKRNSVLKALGNLYPDGKPPETEADQKSAVNIKDHLEKNGFPKVHESTIIRIIKLRRAGQI
jgi:hypothetical protein